MLIIHLYAIIIITETIESINRAEEFILNEGLKKRIQSAGLRQWQIAEALKIGETTLCRWMRKELSPEVEAEILIAIEELSKRVG